MKPVLTTADLEGLGPGSEVTITRDTLVTPLAREEAERRSIAFRVVESASEESRLSEAPPAPRVVAIGADHGGYELKEHLKAYLRDWGFTVLDQGTDSTAAVDYPDFAEAVANALARGEAWRGVVIDSAGLGSAIAANKVPGVRAAVCYDRATARNSREHNDANVLSLGARMISAELAREILALWLEIPFAGGRHQRRVDKIRSIEQRHAKK